MTRPADEPKKKPKVFIGSSSETESVANAIEENLFRDFAPKVWRTAFPPSQSYLDSLIEVLDKSDFAVFVFGPDDILRSRGKDSSAVRDNVLFEAGLAIGRLGKERTFMVSPLQERPALASDLHGIHIGDYDDCRVEEDAVSAVRPFCTEIARLMKSQRPRPGATAAIARLQRLAAEKGDSDLLLHTFCGQDAAPVALEGEAALSERGIVFRLWADAEHANNIRASLAEGDAARVIRINFTNQNHSLPGDVTIRPLGIRAIAVPRNCRFLVFDVRAPLAAPSNAENVARKEPLAIAVRAIDAQATQWCYQERDTRHIFEVPMSDSWRSIAVDLGNPWVRFDSDGNYRYAAERPDFSVISAIVIEVGTRGASRPGPGMGELEIAHIRLCETPPANA